MLTKDSKTWIELYLSNEITANIFKKISIPISDSIYDELMELMQTILAEGKEIGALELYMRSNDDLIVSAYTELSNKVDADKTIGC